MGIGSQFALAAIAGLTLAVLPARARHPEPRFPKVALLPITITATNYKDSPVRLDQAEIMNKLQLEATDRTARDLVRDGLAGHVLRIDAGVPTPDGVPVISGSVILPISIPEKALGMRAHYQSEWFAAAALTVQSNDGRMLAKRHDPIRWKDVEWCRHTNIRAGMWHLANRPLDDVLKDAVDGTIDRAVSRAANQIGRK